MTPAIAIFSYNRVEHLRKTLLALLKELKGVQCNIYLYIDGPKNCDDGAAQEEIFQVAKGALSEFEDRLKVVRRPINLGLKNSVILGVSEILNVEESVFVVEDDLTVVNGVYKYVSDSLRKYENNQDVFQVSCFSYFDGDDNQAKFLPVTSSWGWATWADRWDGFVNDFLSKDIGLLVEEIDKAKFDLSGEYRFSKILSLELSGAVSSWAVLFYAYVFLRDGVVLFPPSSYVENIGFDGSGTHCGSLDVNYSKLMDGDGVIYPDVINVRARDIAKLKESLRGNSLIARLLKRVKGRK